MGSGVSVILFYENAMLYTSEYRQKSRKKRTPVKEIQERQTKMHE